MLNKKIPLSVPKDDLSALINADKISDVISKKYRTRYGADITCQYDDFLVVTDYSGEKLLAATGYRKPSTPFFLEHYLPSSAEMCLSQLYQREIKRQHLVEVGNFVGHNGKAAFTLLHVLLNHLRDQHYQHLLLTCTRQLKRTLHGLPIHVLARASQTKLPTQINWGSYYQQTPEVVTGQLGDYDQRFSRFSDCKTMRVHYCNNQGEFHAI